MKLTNKQLEEVLQCASQIEICHVRMPEIGCNVHIDLDEFIIQFEPEYKYSKYDDADYLTDVYNIRLADGMLEPHDLTPNQIEKIRHWLLYHIKGLEFTERGRLIDL